MSRLDKSKGSSRDGPRDGAGEGTTAFALAGSPDAAALQALLERVEKATDGDRELDLAVAKELNQPWGHTDNPPAEPGGEWWPSNISCGRFSTSLDAALALVERVLPGFRVENLSEWDNPDLRARGPWMAQIARRGKDVFDGRRMALAECMHAPTPALALLAALLRALIAQTAPPPVSAESGIGAQVSQPNRDAL